MLGSPYERLADWSAPQILAPTQTTNYNHQVKMNMDKYIMQSLAECRHH